MLARIRFLLSYYLFWVLWFQAARLLFLIYNLREAKGLPLSEKALSFLYGLRMDLSVGAYFLIPVCVFVICSLYISIFRKPLVYQVYTYVILFFVLLLTVADLEVYKSWGFRMDTTPLRYLRSPKEAWASISHLPVFWILLLFLIGYFLLCWLAKRLLEKRTRLLSGKPGIVVLFVLLLLTSFLIVPIRGGLQLSPMNQSMVYFSKNNFANITAVNATWNFLYSVVHMASSENPYPYMDRKKSEQLVDSLYRSAGKTEMIFRDQNPNVIIIVWESFSKKFTDTTIEGKEITPRFNELKKQGVYFSNVFASGDRTDKGLAAVLSGYPALNDFSVIRYPQKSSRVPALAQFFKARNYNTSFYYGGETEFANIKSYLLESRFDRLIDKKDFASKDLNSKWGAHDGAVTARIMEDLQLTKSPFFISWLTLSSHEPFETPIEPYFKAEDNLTKFCNAIHYTDGVIYDFVQYCSQQPWWNNTVLIIVADHGHHMIPPSNPIKNFEIPMLWLGGALKQKGIVVDKYSSQIDIASSLIDQMGEQKLLFQFSKNIFDSTSKPWAYYSFNNGFGFMQPQGSFAFDNIGRQVIMQTGTVKPQDIEMGKAMQQRTYQDFIDK